MDYSRQTLADRLAADYVLGTLRGPARRRFESLLPAHPALRSAVNEWQSRLNVLSADITPVEPSPQVWAQLQKRLFGLEASTQAGVSSDNIVTRWWQRLALWQSWAALATVAAVGLGLVLQQPLPVQPPVVVVMQSTDPALQQASDSLKTQFVASISGDGRSLVLKPLSGAKVTAQQALELWALPANGKPPHSLGLIASDKATTVVRASLLKGTGAFAVSVEPTGGSPTGAPTGPVISVGKLQL
jgi:anti-sigma-K factor RskA